MLKTHRCLLAVLALVLFCAAAAPNCRGADKIDPDKEKEIRKMLGLTGASKMAQQMMDQMLDSMKGGKTSNEMLDRLKKKLNTDGLMELVIPIYDKYYTTDDLKAVNAFYSSPAGQKLLQSMPMVMKESMAAGQQWGAQIGKKIAEEMAADEKELK